MKLIKIGGLAIGTATILGLINANYETNKKYLPSMKNEDFERNMDHYLSQIDLIPRFSNANTNRDFNIEKAESEEYDLLIIGGGAGGAGVLLNAYNHGLNCALVESNDFASGTSSRSTKMAHGGIRYLHEAFTKGEFSKIPLVIESLYERDFFLHSSPHMNRILEIKIPAKNIFEMIWYYGGLCLYHFLYVCKNLPYLYAISGPKIYSVYTHTPSASNKKESEYSLFKFFKYFVSFHECQMFDSRMNLHSLFTTTIDNYIENRKGSTILNYAEFKYFTYDKEKKVNGAVIFDKINHKNISIKAKTIVNCAGIFADRISYSVESPEYNKLIVASKGTHILLKKNIFNTETGLMIPDTTDGRMIFLFPYQDYFIIGTTDETSEKSEKYSANEKEIDFLVNELKVYFKIDEKLIRDNISAAFSGSRPLFNSSISRNKSESKSISRGHNILKSQNGVINVFGGKWTTYRKIGEDVIEFLEKKGIIPYKSIPFDLDMKLYGSNHPFNQEKKLSYSDEQSIYANLKEFISSRYSISNSTAEKLVFIYGFNVLKLLENGKKTNKNNLIYNEFPILESQVIYSVKHEMVFKINDFLCRRIGLGFLNQEQAISLIEPIGKIIGRELNWSETKIFEEIEESKKNMKFLF